VIVCQRNTTQTLPIRLVAFLLCICDLDDRHVEVDVGFVFGKVAELRVEMGLKQTVKKNSNDQAQQQCETRTFICWENAGLVGLFVV
jgi:hypothetical protein